MEGTDMTKIPVVMIHGMWGHGDVWGPFGDFFANKAYYEVHRPSLPHHLQKEMNREALGAAGLKSYRSFLEDYIAGLDTKPILIGHSMGGLLAQQLAAAELCRAAILICPASPRGVQCIRPVMLPGVARFFLRWKFWERPYRLTPWEAEYSMFHRLEDAVREELVAGLVHESGRVGAEIALWFLDKQRASEVDFARLVCPVLMLASTEDRITPLSVCQENARQFRQAEFEFRILRDAAHWPHREAGWKHVAEVCNNWIQSRMGALGSPNVGELKADRKVG